MSKQNLHNVAGAAPYNEQEFQSTFVSKMCPVINVGIQKQKSSVLTPGRAPQEPALEVLPCQGHACMWFRVIADEHGIPRRGECAMAMTPMALNFLGSVLNGHLSQISQRLPLPNPTESTEPPPVQ